MHMLEGIASAELLETLREAISEDERFIHIAKISLDRDGLMTEISPFGKQITGRLESWEAQQWKDALRELYNHPKSGRFVPLLTDELCEELRASAERKVRKMMALEDQA